MTFSSSLISELLPSTSLPFLPRMPLFPPVKEERGLYPPVLFLSGTLLSQPMYLLGLTWPCIHSSTKSPCFTWTLKAVGSPP